MSINLSIKYKDSQKTDIYIPVVGANTFREFWEPIATELELEWIIYMDNVGIPVLTHLDILPDFLAELGRLHDTISSSTEIAAGEKEHSVQQISELIQHLEMVQKSPDDFEKAFVG